MMMMIFFRRVVSLHALQAYHLLNPGSVELEL